MNKKARFAPFFVALRVRARYSHPDGGFLLEYAPCVSLGWTHGLVSQAQFAVLC
ncbi:hypothetical protein DEU50_101479 [Aeromonas salmonicida]|uniref:Uncharacterized protein n=1 Tax=Aeromonas salmonicida TaxID=645 RepID=A0AAX1PPW9_AERSA|nr:hypothetical protein DEU50_101479 [Aeromonas salmonicida]